VDKLPTQVTPLGTRQVGEVGCVIENPDRDLLPNANINAEIQAAVVPGALVLPKEAFRREGPDTGVFLLRGERVEWRKVTLGVSSYTKSQVLSGLAEGDAVALPTEKTIKNGSKVEAVVR
jgi:HlyD family secretion protein